MGSFEAAYGTEMRNLADALCRIDTSGGNEAAGQGIIRETLIEHGFEVFEWTADADTLAAHPSFPPSDELDVDDRPSLGGVLEFGDPDRGPTLVLNGHVDVVPATPAGWTADPFEPQWDGGHLVARGAADMKSQLAACLFAARYLADDPGGIDGRIVVESVAGEEEGGIGAAAAVLDAPYPFDRTAAIVTEPTNRRVVTATEGCLMMRLGIQGREAHAARKDRGVDVLPRFDAARRTFEELESERNAQVSHPRFDRFDAPWPVVIGRVAAGNWASNVAGSLTAEMRIGVAPEETLDAVESQFRNRLDAVVDADDWLRTHPPSFDRFGIQFTSAAIEPDEPVVRTLQTALDDRGIELTEATGETYGTDARHYIEAGIPTVVWGPGRIEEAHFPDESIDWRDVLQAAAVLADTSRRFLGRDVSTL